MRFQFRNFRDLPSIVTDSCFFFLIGFFNFKRYTNTHWHSHFFLFHFAIVQFPCRTKKMKKKMCISSWIVYYLNLFLLLLFCLVYILANMRWSIAVFVTAVAAVSDDLIAYVSCVSMCAFASVIKTTKLKKKKKKMRKKNSSGFWPTFFTFLLKTARNSLWTIKN